MAVSHDQAATGGFWKDRPRSGGGRMACMMRQDRSARFGILIMHAETAGACGSMANGMSNALIVTARCGEPQVACPICGAAVAQPVAGMGRVWHWSSSRCDEGAIEGLVVASRDLSRVTGNGSAGFMERLLLVARASSTSSQGTLLIRCRGRRRAILTANNRPPKGHSGR